MRIGQTICVMLLGMAIAMAPLSMGFAVAAPQANTAATMMQAMPDCDHHQHQHGAPNGPTQKTVDHGNCITGCALCSIVINTDASAISYVMAASSMLTPAPAADSLSSLMGSPPFRPPRA
jgi:hypothetical protein